jgi:hypothetical protein
MWTIIQILDPNLSKQIEAQTFSKIESNHWLLSTDRLVGFQVLENI